MADYTMIAIAAMIISLVAYVIVIIKKNSGNNSENAKISRIGKIAQYFSSTGSLEKAIRQLVSESPSAGGDYGKIIKKIDEGIDIAPALEQAASESNSPFFSNECMLMAAAHRKNDSNLLYTAAQNIKEVSALHSMMSAKSRTDSWLVQALFCIFMPLIFFFMVSILGFSADMYINLFLSVIVLASIIFQGIVFRQWVEAAVKIPLLFSLFYLLYFVAAPMFFSGLISQIA